MEKLTPPPVISPFTRPENKETIAFALIYNVQPDQEILDVDFNGYRILPFDIFASRYNSHIVNLKVHNFWTYESIINSIKPQYVLVATTLYDKDTSVDINTIPPESIFSTFLNTVLYLRLYKSGDIQMGTFFVSYKGNEKPAWRNISHTNFVCFMTNPQYPGYQHSWKPYTLNAAETAELLSFINELEQKDLTKAYEILQATGPFTRAFDTPDLSYKITNLVTVLECLLADDGKEGEISFKLRTRLIFLLGEKNLVRFISDIYEIRSEISHKGTLSKAKFITKFKKKNGRDFTNKDMFEYIEQLENICRKVLNYFLKKFINEDMGNIQAISNELNQAMFSKLAENSSI